MPVVFKLRVKDPNLPDMADKNRAHIMYIGKYSGAGKYIAKNMGMEHGLFGKYNERDFGDIESIENAAAYVKRKTLKGTIMYRNIISLEESTAIAKGFDNRKDWEDFIQQQIFSMAEKIGIPASRLEYVCAVHMERGHPHMHFTMWDKNQGIKKPFVHESVSNSIRLDLNKAVFHEELSELYEIKNNARQALTDGTKDFFNGFFESFEMDSNSVFIEELKANPDHAGGYMFSPNVSDESLDSFAKSIFEFKSKIPKSGRVTYKTLTPDLKEELKNIIKELIATNEDFSREFDIFIDTNVELTAFYASDENLEEAQEKAAQSAEEDILKRLSNQLLKEIKNIDTQQRQQENQEKQQAFMRYQAFMVMKSLFSYFSRFSESENNRRDIAIDRRKGELSKQARKELAIKLEHASGIDWER